MNILTSAEIETTKLKAGCRLADYLKADFLTDQQELELFTSAQTLLFLSLLENKPESEIEKSRALCVATKKLMQARNAKPLTPSHLGESRYEFTL